MKLVLHNYETISKQKKLVFVNINSIFLLSKRLLRPEFSFRFKKRKFIFVYTLSIPRKNDDKIDA